MSGSWEPFGRTPVPEPTAAPDAPAPAPEAAQAPAAHLGRRPRRGLAVVACMDSRLDPLRDLGLERGDASSSDPRASVVRSRFAGRSAASCCGVSAARAIPVTVSARAPSSSR